MKRNYERWVMKRLAEKPRCSVEPTICCIPLRGDPICMTCFETEFIGEPGDKSDNT